MFSKTYSNRHLEKRLRHAYCKDERACLRAIPIRWSYWSWKKSDTDQRPMMVSVNAFTWSISSWGCAGGLAIAFENMKMFVSIAVLQGANFAPHNTGDCNSTYLIHSVSVQIESMSGLVWLFPGSLLSLLLGRIFCCISAFFLGNERCAFVWYFASLAHAVVTWELLWWSTNLSFCHLRQRLLAPRTLLFRLISSLPVQACSVHTARNSPLLLLPPRS